MDCFGKWEKGTLFYCTKKVDTSDLCVRVKVWWGMSNVKFMAKNHEIYIYMYVNKHTLFFFLSPLFQGSFTKK